MFDFLLKTDLPKLRELIKSDIAAISEEAITSELDSHEYFTYASIDTLDKFIKYEPITNKNSSLLTIHFDEQGFPVDGKSDNEDYGYGKIYWLPLFVGTSGISGIQFCIVYHSNKVFARHGVASGGTYVEGKGADNFTTYKWDPWTELSGGEKNLLEVIKVNGSPLEITDKTVNLELQHSYFLPPPCVTASAKIYSHTSRFTFPNGNVSLSLYFIPFDTDLSVVSYIRDYLGFDIYIPGDCIINNNYTNTTFLKTNLSILGLYSNSSREIAGTNITPLIEMYEYDIKSEYTNSLFYNYSSIKTSIMNEDSSFTEKEFNTIDDAITEIRTAYDVSENTPCRFLVRVVSETFDNDLETAWNAVLLEERRQ